MTDILNNQTTARAGLAPPDCLEYAIERGRGQHRPYKAIILILLFFFATAGTCLAQERTPEELASVLDPFMQKELKGLHIPGTVVLVVKDGKIFLVRGYGFSDLEQKKRVRANTLFRMGSISKLFVATAILQLVEQGKLHLEDEVNPYLKTFQLDNPFPEPVRVFNLLTHTAGFDEKNIGSATQKRKEVIPLGKYLAKHMPPCIHPPGSIISYSNHGYTLAGYLVELISGMPFDQYVNEHVIYQLGMNRSGFGFQPNPDSNLAIGYAFENKKYRALPFDYLNDEPADGLVSDANDMARFLIANLQQGEYEGHRILQPATMELMHRQHYTLAPGLAGWCYGWYEEFRNNKRCLIHDGAVYGFNSRVWLVPDDNLGFMIATNTDVTNNDLTPAVTGRIMDFFFGRSARPVRHDPPPGFQTRLPLYEGHYRHVALATRTLEKVAVLMDLVPEFKIVVTNDGVIQIWNRTFRETKPFFLEQSNGKNSAALRQDKTGAVTHLFFEYEAFEKIPLYETKEFQEALGIFCLACFLLNLMFWLIWLVATRKRASELKSMYHLTGIIAIAHLVFFSIIYIFIFQRSIFELCYGVPIPVKLGLILPLLAIVLTVLLCIALIKNWKTLTALPRIYFSLFSVIALTFLWILNYWNLIGFRY